MVESGVNAQRVSQPQPAPLAVVEVVRDDTRCRCVALRHPFAAHDNNRFKISKAALLLEWLTDNGNYRGGQREILGTLFFSSKFITLPEKPAADQF